MANPNSNCKKLGNEKYLRKTNQDRFLKYLPENKLISGFVYPGTFMQSEGFSDNSAGLIFSQN
jgi:hypothetical protein